MSGAPALGRRSLLLGGAAVTLSGCELSFPARPRTDHPCFYEAESPIGANQTNCDPVHGTNPDLAWHLRVMKVPEAWAFSEHQTRPSRGRGIIIGHVDTGVAAHADFDAGGILWERGFDFVDDLAGGRDPLINHIEYIEQIGHGTGTASVIVSRGEVTNGWTVPKPSPQPQPVRSPEPYDRYRPERKPEAVFCSGTLGPGRITGVAPAADLIPVRAFRLAATSRLDRVAKAVDYLRKQNVDVITMALGWLFSSEELRAAIKAAIKENIIVLAAAGNFVSHVTFPARDGDVIAVGAIGPKQDAWCGGSQGPSVTVAAPGDSVWRAYRDEKSNRLDLVAPRYGTSFAVSLTAGVAALWLAHNGGREALIRCSGLISGTNPVYRDLQEVFRNAIMRTAHAPQGWERHRSRLGTGIVDAEALLKSNPSDKKDFPA